MALLSTEKPAVMVGNRKPFRIDLDFDEAMKRAVKVKPQPKQQKPKKKSSKAKR